MGGRLELLQGDCREVLPTLVAQSVQCCVTSPPYWGLRDYGCHGQLGLEPTFDDYVAKMVDVFREVGRVLRDDGTLWVNMGDSYAGPNGWQPENQKTSTLGRKRDGLTPENAAFISKPKRCQVVGLKPKDLCGIPWLRGFSEEHGPAIKPS
jgi:DNA modification methylase